MAEQNSATNHITGDPASGDAWEGTPSRLMSQEGVFQLTQDLRKFSETLISLKTVFSEERDVLDPSLRVAAHERLGELLKVLKSIVNKYEELNSTGILNAAENLINHIKNFNYEGMDEVVSPEIFSAINNLALAFSSSVSECLIGDINISPRQSMISSHSYENIQLAQQGQQRQSQYDSTPEIAPANSTVTVDATGPLASSETVTDALNHFTQDLDVCFDRAKAWSRYANDLISYVKKKAHIDMEYAKQLTKLSQSTRAVLSEQSYLPFQSLYCTALDNDKEYASKMNTMYQNEILAHKFIEVLQSRRIDHDRIHKSLREAWRKDKRRLEEAETNLRKAKQQYQTRNQEYLKAKEAATRADQQQFAAAGVGEISHTKQGSGSNLANQLAQNVVAGSALGIVGSSKVEKRRKQEDDSYMKAAQAEHYYIACVNEANKKREELGAKEEDYMRQIRDLMTECDQITKSVTLSFFQLHCELASPIRVQYEALLEESKNYEPGFQYGEYLRHVAPHHISQRVNYQFEPFGSEGDIYREHSHGGNDENVSSRTSHIGYPMAPRRISHKGLSDTESSSSRSLDEISPSASPGDRTNRKDLQNSKRRLSTEGSLSSEEILDDNIDTPKMNPTIEKIATSSPESSPAPQRSQMPRMMKYVKEAFKGMKRNPKATIYGVDFSVACQEAQDGVPLLIKKCIAEIDNRALTVKGIYRVNGVKNRVEKLCAMLDTPHSVRVDLSEQLPHDVSGVLKYFLRQLPEPLLLYRLYEEFLEVAKEYTDIAKAIKLQQQNKAEENAGDNEQSLPENEPEDQSAKFSATLAKMHNIIEKLPEANHNTLQYIVGHLSRVAEHSSSNKMTASNLAIIFGPTLLRPLPQPGNELQSLIDLSSQSQAIEILITHRNKIFDPYSHTVDNEDIKDSHPKNQVVQDFEELQINNHEQQGVALSQRPKLNTAPTQQPPVTSTPSEEVPANVDQVHVSLDGHSTSGTSSSGEIFITGTDDSAQSTKKDSFSSENPQQIGQSNGGMAMNDGGRTVISRSPRLTKSSATSDLMRGTLGAFIDGRDSIRRDISANELSSTPANTNLSPRDTKPQNTRPSSLSVGSGTGPGSTSNIEGYSPKAGRSPSSPTSTEQPRSRNPSGDPGLTTSVILDAPMAPIRSKTKRLSESGKASAETTMRSRSPSLQSPASPHRPRSKIIGSFVNRSVSHNETISDSSSGIAPSAKHKRNSAIASLFPSSTKSDAKNRTAPTTGRRLPQLPKTKPAMSPTRTRPISKPGRTPPFNKTPTWSFAKTDIGEMSNADKRVASVPKRIFLEDDEEEVSLC